MRRTASATPSVRACSTSTCRRGPPPTSSRGRAGDGGAQARAAAARACPAHLRGMSRLTQHHHRLVGGPGRGAPRTRAAGLPGRRSSGTKTPACTPGDRRTGSSPSTGASRAAVHPLTAVTASTSRPTRRSACRAPGTRPQPTSCPCVRATAGRTPARRSAGARSPQGRGRPEPGRRAAAVPCQAHRPAGDARRRQQHRGGHAVDLVGQRRVGLRSPRPVRRQHHHLLRGQPGEEPRQERLDAGPDAAAGRW